MDRIVSRHYQSPGMAGKVISPLTILHKCCHNSYMELVGIRDLKNRLTHFLSLVKKGDEVIVTDRGTPIAIIHSLDKTEIDASPEEKLASLAVQGLIKLPSKGKKFDLSTKAVVVKGKPLSEIVIEERR